MFRDLTTSPDISIGQSLSSRCGTRLYSLGIEGGRRCEGSLISVALYPPQLLPIDRSSKKFPSFPSRSPVPPPITSHIPHTLQSSEHMPLLIDTPSISNYPVGDSLGLPNELPTNPVSCGDWLGSVNGLGTGGEWTNQRARSEEGHPWLVGGRSLEVRDVWAIIPPVHPAWRI